MAGMLPQPSRIGNLLGLDLSTCNQQACGCGKQILEHREISDIIPPLERVEFSPDISPEKLMRPTNGDVLVPNKQLLIYDDLQPLSSNKHRSWSVHVNDAHFAAGLTSVPLLIDEIPLASREFPVIFSPTTNQGEYLPMALIGLRDQENLLLDHRNQMLTRHIPAFFRRYPFAFSANAQGKMTLCIDEKSKFFDPEGKRGKRLFDDNGGQTEHLTQVVEFLQVYQQRAHITQLFCRRLNELKLIEPAEADINLKDHPDESFKAAGFYTVRRERLKQLSAADLYDLCQREALEIIYLHLNSLDNFNRLSDLLSSRLSEELQALSANI